jgi:integrase
VTTRRPNGEGTIYQRRDGRWEGAAYVLTPSGGRSRKRVYGRTRSEVFERLAELQQGSRRGLPVASSELRLGPFLEDWLTNVAQAKVRPSTYHGYAKYLRLYLLPALGKKRLTRLTPTDVRTFLASPELARLSPATRRQIHAILRAGLQHALREDLVARNVAKLVVMPAARSPEIVPLTVEEARRLLEAAEGSRLYALWAVALAVGLRRGEALGLRWCDVDLEAGTLRVVQTLQRTDGRLDLVPPKSERSRRRVPVPDVAVTTLRRHRVQAETEAVERGEPLASESLVFTSLVGTPLEPRNVNRAFAALLAGAGLRHVRLHDLRHTFATPAPPCSWPRASPPASSWRHLATPPSRSR